MTGRKEERHREGAPHASNAHHQRDAHHEHQERVIQDFKCRGIVSVLLATFMLLLASIIQQIIGLD